jgi:SAM-dependent methyltransferase
MTELPTETLAAGEPAFDLAYSIRDLHFSRGRDHRFLAHRTEEALVEEASIGGSRALDVGCGTGQQAARLGERGVAAWGVEPSQEMLGLSRMIYPADQVVLVRGVAEALPLREDSFDQVICRCALDHFVDPDAFMREAARVLRPGGRVIIALNNYDSLTCQLVRLGHHVARALFDRSPFSHRRLWEPPADHNYRSKISFARSLGGRRFRLDRCYGVSLLWGFPGWGPCVDALPFSLAKALLTMLDRIARRTPALADIIVSVWRARGA